MWRNIASNALTLLIVLVFLLAGLILWGKTQYTGPGPLTERICLEVERGTTMTAISRKLKAQGAVSNDLIYRVGTEYAGLNDDLKAGSFLIPEEASMAEIADIITRGGGSTCGTELLYRIGIAGMRLELRELDPQTEKYQTVAEHNSSSEEPQPEAFSEARGAADTRYRITMAEGVTSWQVMTALENIQILSGTVETPPEEGTLAPDSYELRMDDTRQAVIDRMQEKQEFILSSAWEDRAEDLPIETMQEALILASIIEKETGVPDERRQVASVFVNRLKRGMRLQTDPTVIYGITKGRRALGRGLRQSELRGETPWNTYVIDGLPPTPIANPGPESIAAAVNPADTGYVYFVADGSGGHAFSETLSEHNANVAKWRRIEAEENGD
ncbi:MAG: endolytic transglycosylase MltG [Sediminimonas sp.]|uniref:endolytic transglycosylase MltG n=1 Tax=Sediminimonas sp. TaxID=2823379 RepID=UPI0028705685|nr:endolytic transglycosylase MltG [Sediminimonas sp.]MDR9484067.1 endolytic transglycosylase MltG [Sediminimonas sp.]